MPVKLWTGLPGAGKTAAMVDAMLKFKAENPHRPLYAININGLAPGVAEPLTHEQLQRWWELPPESVICIDECQEDEFFPLDQGKPADWVKRLSKVRHEGMDFWMTTQHPALMSAYVRRLVDQHVHTVRKFNTSVVQRFTWGRCMDACEKGQAQKMAVQSVGTLPAAVFDAYKSSNAHNMKRRIPLKAWLLPVLIVVGIAAAIAAPIMLHRAEKQNVAAIGGKPSAAASAGAADATLRQKDYGKWLAPRVPGIPWTAPAFDGQTVKSDPRVYCIAAADGQTACVSEQGTKLDVPAPTARLIAANGVYNPFQPPARDSVQGEGEKGPAATGKPQARLPLVPAPSLPDQASASGAAERAGISDPYQPPGSMPWNPDPFGGSK